MRQQLLENKQLYWVFVGELTAEGQRCLWEHIQAQACSWKQQWSSERLQVAIQSRSLYRVCYLHQSPPRQTEKCKPIDVATGYLEPPSMMQLENVLAVRRDTSYRERMN